MGVKRCLVAQRHGDRIKTNYTAQSVPLVILVLRQKKWGRFCVTCANGAQTIPVLSVSLGPTRRTRDVL